MNWEHKTRAGFHKFGQSSSGSKQVHMAVVFNAFLGLGVATFPTILLHLAHHHVHQVALSSSSSSSLPMSSWCMTLKTWNHWRDREKLLKIHGLQKVFTKVKSLPINKTPNKTNKVNFLSSWRPAASHKKVRSANSFASLADFLPRPLLVAKLL